MRAICEWLEPRRLITTELHLTGPRYTEIGKLSARLSVGRATTCAASPTRRPPR